MGKALTVDHYYLPLDRQPKYQARKLRSDVDYDAIESMDAELVNEHINGLLEGKRVMAPVCEVSRIRTPLVCRMAPLLLATPNPC